jgi:DNA-binding FrmR family transcriptional regulator
MVEQGRYCVDILTQMRAVRAALAKVEQRVLRDHIEHCVAAAIRDGDRSRQEVKMDELFEVLSRFTG